MSNPHQIEPHPEAIHYASCLGRIAQDLLMLTERSVEFPKLRQQLQGLTFYLGLLRLTLPRDGTAIGPRWWQRYARFDAIVEELSHPAFDDEFELIWMGLPQTN